MARISRPGVSADLPSLRAWFAWQVESFRRFPNNPAKTSKAAAHVFWAQKAIDEVHRWLEWNGHYKQPAWPRDLQADEERADVELSRLLKFLSALEREQQSEPAAVPAAEPAPAAEPELLRPLEKALAMLMANPDKTDKQIAAAVGVHVKTMNKPAWQKYKAARAALAGSVRKGSKVDGRIEAEE